MPAAIPLEQLEVIGYADALDPGMFPSIVPPVFRFRQEPERLLVPPYSLNGGFVCGASEIGLSEIRELRDAAEMVLFETPFPVRNDFELWIDESAISHYQTRISARSHLRKFSDHSIHQAKIAFSHGGIAEAERFCSAAISADDKCVEAFVIKAAIRRRQNDADGERLMAKLVSPYLDLLSFGMLVDGYSAPQPTVIETQPVPPMRWMATYKTHKVAA